MLPNGLRGLARHPALLLQRRLGEPLRVRAFAAASDPQMNTRTNKELKVTSIGKTGRTERDEAGKYKGHTFPELLEHWSREKFYQVGYLGLGGAGLTTVAAFGVGSGHVPALMLDAAVAAYWYVGKKDIAQTNKAIPHNFPVLGNLRYLLESIRPEIRQYFVESDDEATPYDRAHRAMAYQRAKNATDTLPLGTRRDVYEEGYEWIGHSMFPKHMDPVRTWYRTWYRSLSADGGARMECAGENACSTLPSFPRGLRLPALMKLTPLTVTCACVVFCVPTGEDALHGRRARLQAAVLRVPPERLCYVLRRALPECDSCA